MENIKDILDIVLDIIRLIIIIFKSTKRIKKIVRVIKVIWYAILGNDIISTSQKGCGSGYTSDGTGEQEIST